jgi:hypothetical protein
LAIAHGTQIDGCGCSTVTVAHTDRMMFLMCP